VVYYVISEGAGRIEVTTITKPWPMNESTSQTGEYG
jgi:hypothetical protein